MKQNAKTKWLRAAFRKRELRTWQQLLLAVLLAGAITFLEVWIQPNSLLNTMYDFVHYPIVLLLNVFPALLLVIGLGAMSGNICYGAALTELLLCGLSIGNRMKIEYRNEPVWPGDLLLVNEVQDAVAHYSLKFPVKIIAAVIVCMLLLVVLGRIFRDRRTEGNTGRRIAARLGMFLLCGAVLTGMIFTVYASDDLYEKNTRVNAYRLAAVYCEKGTTYSFLHNITAKTVECPEGYDTETAELWDTEQEENAAGEQVHVIMVMCEAFSDITDQGVFCYDAEDDPLKNFHALTRDGHALSGHLVVSRFGGGTANTEYDVLTGMQASALSASTATAFYAVERNLDSLYRVFGADGYETGFIHPGYDWFYNRKNVSAYLGARSTEFYDDMTDKEMKGTWVTDDYLARHLEAAFEETVASGSLMFTYMTTIENHTVYSYDKFGEGYEFPKAKTDITLDADLQEIADVYVEGLRDTDAMIGRLTEYFSAREEPVVLAFFGDHLPSLGGNFANYQALGIELSTETSGTAEYLKSCETPWVIWANDAAAETLDWDSRVSTLDLPEDGTLSASYLGAVMLELTGRGDSTAWFSWLNQLRRELPVVCGDTVELPDGTITNSLTREQEALISKWQCWSYYKLKYKTVE